MPLARRAAFDGECAGALPQRMFCLDTFPPVQFSAVVVALRSHARGDGRRNEVVGFSVPCNVVRAEGSSLLEPGTSRRPLLGDERWASKNEARRADVDWPPPELGISAADGGRGNRGDEDDASRSAGSAAF